MRPLALGIDCGSSFCKGVLLDEGGIKALAVLPTGWDIAESGRRTVEELFKLHPSSPQEISSLPLIAAGYGREKIEGRSNIVTEIGAHAAGAEFLRPGVRTVIDIGGQDCKIIAVEHGRAKDFQMNDKCAAGSGRFVEMIRQRLNVNPSLMEELLSLDRHIALNSTCVVFAESEIIGLLARGVSREEIMGGVAASLAVRIAALAARLPMAEPAVLSGGLSGSAGFAKALSRTLGLDVRPLEQGAYAGAIGAALGGLRDVR
jgi:predicted CoA-substrate-specific enzyme activase